MAPDDPIVLEIMSDSFAAGSVAVRINGVSAPAGSPGLSFVLQSPVVQVVCGADHINIIVDGADDPNPTPLSKGVCLCVTPDTSIALTVIESIKLSVHPAFLHHRLPDGVHCGDGGDLE